MVQSVSTLCLFAIEEAKTSLLSGMMIIIQLLTITRRNFQCDHIHRTYTVLWGRETETLFRESHAIVAGFLLALGRCGRFDMYVGEIRALGWQDFRIEWNQECARLLNHGGPGQYYSL